MESSSNIVYHPKLTKPDRVVLQNLDADIEGWANSEGLNFRQDGCGMKSGSAQQNVSGMSARNLFAMVSIMVFYLFFFSFFFTLFTKPLLNQHTSDLC